MPQCTHARDVQLYIDNELSAQQREGFLAHVASCNACAELLEEEAALDRRIRAAAASAERAPASLRLAVEQRIAAAQREKRTVSIAGFQGRHRGPLAWTLSIAAACLLVAAVFVWRTAQQAGLHDMRQEAWAAQQGLQDGSLKLDVVSSSQEQVAKWFTGRLPFAFHFANAGIATDDRARYTLQGAKILTLHKKRVALIAFNMPDQAVSLLIGPASMGKATGNTVVKSGGISFYSHDREAMHVVSWNNRGLLYVLTSRMSMGNPQQCDACHKSAPPAVSQKAAALTDSAEQWQNSSTADPVLHFVHEAMAPAFPGNAMQPPR